MPLLSTASKNDALDAQWGPGAAALMPDGFRMLLYTGGAPDPDGEGREVTDVECPGYTEGGVAFDHSGIPDAVDGVKTISVQMDPPTDEWTVQVDCWVIVNAADLDDIRRYGFPEEPLEITAASDDGPLVEATLFYDIDLED